MICALRVNIKADGEVTVEGKSPDGWTTIASKPGGDLEGKTTSQVAKRMRDKLLVDPAHEHENGPWLRRAVENLIMCLPPPEMLESKEDPIMRASG